MNQQISTFARFRKKATEYLLPFILGLAIVMLILYYVFRFIFSDFFSAHSGSFKELFSIALAILSSGIFLAVLKWFQFMGFFREELHSIIQSSQFNNQLQDTFNDVMYSEEFLAERKDIEAIWKRVTRCYFKSEFTSDISDKINKKLSNIFYHNNKISHFMRNNIISMNITLDDTGFLTIEETCEYKIMRPREDEFTFDFCYYIERIDETDIRSKIEIISFSLDGQLQDIKNSIEKKTDGNFIQEKYTTTIKGKREYDIIIKAKLCYNINHDNMYSCFNERVVEYTRVEVTFTQNLLIQFIPIGNEPFTDLTQEPQKFIKVFNDILLPEKGFRLIFTPNKIKP